MSFNRLNYTCSYKQVLEELCPGEYQLATPTSCEPCFNKDPDSSSTERCFIEHCNEYD